MDTINARISAAVKASGVSQVELARRMDVTPQYVSKLCKTGAPSDRTIASFCKNLSVNEVWLRDGVGPMFVERSRRDDLFDYARRILGGDLSDTEAAVLAVMAETTPEEWELFAAKVRAIVDGLDAKKEQTDP